MRTKLNSLRSSRLNTGNPRTGLNSGTRSRLLGPINSLPPPDEFRILEDGDFRILENGDFRILQ